MIGLVTSLLGGLGVTNAAQNAFDTVWAVPFKDRPNFLQQPAARSGAAGLPRRPVHRLDRRLGPGQRRLRRPAGQGRRLRGLAAGQLRAVLRRLPPDDRRNIPSRDLRRRGRRWRGVLWTILQSVGGFYIGHVRQERLQHLRNVRDRHRAAGVAAPGRADDALPAEINVVVTRRLWPRSLFGPPQAPADKRTLRALAKVEERPDEQTGRRRVQDLRRAAHRPSAVRTGGRASRAGSSQRPRAQAALGRTAAADGPVGRRGDRELPAAARHR